MRFATPLEPAQLIRRYKRFLIDVTTASGETLTASCPNTGSMHGLTTPDSRVWLSRSDNPKRKYPHTLEIVEADGNLVGVNTQHPNKLVREGIEQGVIEPLAGYASLKPEQKYGENSRIDILLSDPERGHCYVEVKNTHMKRGPEVEFPDAVTSRGTKHLKELAAMVAAGHRAVMVYLVQRDDADVFRIAADIDPAYAAALQQARAAGVEALVYACRVTPEEIVVHRQLQIDSD